MPKCSSYYCASSAEFVGGLRFGESSKRVKQGHFHGFIGSKAEGSSGNHSYLVALEELGIGTAVYHFNSSGDPLYPAYEPYLAVSIHGQMHLVKTMIAKLRTASHD
jgi:hypothetical protein